MHNGGVTTLNGRYHSLPKLSDFCFLKGAFEAVVLCSRHISQSLEQGVSVSRVSWSRWTMTLLVPCWPPEYFQLGSSGFDYILWVLIVSDPAHRWLHFIRAKASRILPVERDISADHWRLSADLDHHGTVRDMSQVHTPPGWYGSQLTSTCPPGPASPSTPRPPASLWDDLTYPSPGCSFSLKLLNHVHALQKKNNPTAFRVCSITFLLRHRINSDSLF